MTSPGRPTVFQVSRRSPNLDVAASARPPVRAAQASWPGIATIAVVLSLAFYRFTQTVADPDLWGHIKFGEIVWRAGTVAVSDPFSYLTAGRQWVNHEWLSEVVFYLVFTTAGAAGLIAMKAGLGVAMMSALYRHLCRQGLSALRAGFLVVAVVHFFLMSLVTVRTLIFSYPLFLVVLLLVHAAARGRPRWMWAVPPLFALWANLHPGFLAGLGILGIWATVEIWVRVVSDRQPLVDGRPTTREILLLVTACGLATLMNPHGLTLWTLLRQTAFVPRPDISEWHPLVLMTPHGLAYAAFVALALWGTIHSRRRRRASVMAVLVVTALLPLVALRHAPLAALAVAVLAGEHIGNAWGRWISTRPRSGPAGRVSRIWFPVGALGAAALLTFGALSHMSCIRITPAIGGSYPARAVALIKQSGVTGNLAIDFDWGEYALYHLGPAVKVSVDGRRETAYSPEIYEENLAFKYGEGDWAALLQKHDTHMALVRTGFPTFNLLKLEPAWRLVYQDPVAALFGRDGLPAVEALRQTTLPRVPPDGAGVCVP